MDDSTIDSLSRTAEESKGFLGISSIPCSGRHTTSIACDISAKLDIADLDRGTAALE
jgi:hypothetical protein